MFVIVVRGFRGKKTDELAVHPFMAPSLLQTHCDRRPGNSSPEGLSSPVLLRQPDPRRPCSRGSSPATSSPDSLGRLIGPVFVSLSPVVPKKRPNEKLTGLVVNRVIPSPKQNEFLRLHKCSRLDAIEVHTTRQV